VRIRIAVPEEYVAPPVIDAALEAVTRLDESLIRSGQSPTSRELIRAGARWRPEDLGDEHFDHGGTIAQRGWGDCDDWAPLHAATLRATGEDTKAFARVVPSGPSTYHAIVQRSDGSIDDPSIAAGMKRQSSSVVGGAMNVWAEDPHDGRIYQGSLVPSVGPISGHCGPGITFRAAHVVGCGTLYEARCDLPIQGSPLLRMRGRTGRRRVHGSVPYALSCTAQDWTAQSAMNTAITGAVLCGDASELTVNLDRYKLLAVQAGLAGHSPGEVREMLKAALHHDIDQHAQATGTDPSQHTESLKAELAREGVHVHGAVVGGFFDDIGKIASGIVHTVSNVVNDVAHVVKAVPWGDILHGVQAAVSVVPGLGTAVSDVVAAAETAYESAAALLSGNPLAGAIHAAYNFATATIPGASAIRFVLDPVVEVFISLTEKKEPIESALLDGILTKVPDAPSFAGVSPRTIAASIGHLIVNHLGMKHTGTHTNPAPGATLVTHLNLNLPAAGPAPTPLVHTAAQYRAAMAHKAAQQHAAALHAPLHVAPHPAIHMGPRPSRMAKPMGVPHAALHVTHAPPRAAPLRPGSPGAPPGATHWVCKRQHDGSWACRWV
jgi:hypothetical protein